MRIKNRLTQADRDAYRKQATTVTKLAGKHRVTPHYIKKWLIADGLELNAPGAKRKMSRLSPRDLQGYQNRNVSVFDLAVKHRVSGAVARRWLMQAGIALHYGSTPRFDLEKTIHLIARRVHGEALETIAKDRGVCRQAIEQSIAKSLSTMIKLEIEKLHNQRSRQR